MDATPLPFLEIHEHVTGFNDPVDIQSTPAFPNRVFVVESGGTIRVIESDALLPDPFLQVSPVHAYGESGLLGLAFPPGPAAASRCYVHYNRTNASGRILTVISRFAIDSTTGLADPLTESVLLEAELDHHRHKGGQVAFGPDGYLYVGIGDTVNALSAQDRSTLSGKIIRIDPEGAPAGTTYLIPPANPPAADPTHRPEILFSGLRNPRHFSFHPETGGLFICDVGRSQRHEINVIAADDISRGGNLGWPYKEGSADYLPNPPATETLLPPSFDYASNESDRITGGLLLNRGDERLQDIYIFGDLRRGPIRNLTFDPASGWISTALLDTNAAISCFGVDQAGTMLFADAISGSIFRLTARDQPDPPLPNRNSGTYATTGSYEIGFQDPILATEIRYTLDGSDPIEGGIPFPPGGSITIDHPVTLRARCFRQDLNPSELVERVINLAPIQPEITLLGPTNDEVDVRLTTTTGECTIHYTTDGSTPDESSPRYTSPFRVASSLTINARAFRTGWSPSLTTARHVGLQVSPPTSQTSLGLYEPMRLSSATAGAAIHYQPLGTTEPSIYTSPIHDFQTYKWHATASKGNLQPSTALIDAIRVDSRRVSARPMAPDGYPRDDSGPTSTTPIGWPQTVAATPDGTIFTASPQVYDRRWMLAAGQTTRIYDEGDADGLMRLDSLGRLHVGTNWRILILDPPYDAVTTEIRIPDLSDLSDFLVDPDGTYVIASGDHIYRYAGATRLATLAGHDGAGETPLEGPADSIRLGSIGGLARLPNGDYVFSEHGLDLVRKLTPDGFIKLAAGGGGSGHRDGGPGSSLIRGGGPVASDAIGNAYFANGTIRGAAIRKIAPDGTISTLTGPLVDATTLEVIQPDFSQNTSVGDIAATGDGSLVLAVVGNGLYMLDQEDWDNDLVPDHQERTLGAPFTVGVDDRLVDSDLDGHSNTAEFHSFTNPADPGETPQHGTINRTDGFFYATIPVTPGSPHQVEFSPDGSTWYPMGSPLSPLFRSVTRRDQASAAVPTRLYRATPVQ